MKSTDMFLSATERVFSQILIILSSSLKPKGLAPSPFVISLWEENKLPEKKENETHEEELQTIDNLFRGNGRIKYNNPSLSKNEVSDSFEEIQNIYSQNLPKKIRIPSRSEQLEKIKQSKNEYSAIFKTPSPGTGGFFRNFAFWK